MTPAEAFAACEATVRRADSDRYFASLFAPAEKRPLLFALYCFNHELARAVEVARDPMTAEIRLQWWREALEDAREGRSRAHPAAIGLAEIISQNTVQASDLERFIDARTVENSSTPFETLAEMELHAHETSASLMRMAARVLGRADDVAGQLDESGIAYGLAGMLRSFPFHAARGKLFLPRDLLAAESLSGADALLGKNSGRLRRVFEQLKLAALEHFGRAKQIAVPRNILPAVVPASLVPAYLSRLTTNTDPLRERTDISRLRRQIILLRAAVLGRL
jgi:phytoene synthase